MKSDRRKFRPHWLFLVLAVQLLVPISTLWGAYRTANVTDLEPGRDKISSVILAHQREKMQTLSVMSSKPMTTLYDILPEIKAVPELTEQCALYVEAPLTDDEIAELANEGIVVHNTYIPAVPGKHPYGFYLASVSYASLDLIRQDIRFVKLDSTEFQSMPLNDKASQHTKVDRLRKEGSYNTWTFTGRGVKIAIADSGLDIDHKDIPTPIEAFDVTDGDSIETWGKDVSNPSKVHGTPVTGTALGRGILSNGKYVGAAPGADLYFYKIFPDDGRGASYDDIIEAIKRAQEVGCDIISLSIGGISLFMDGSSSVCQTIDWATSEGMACFVAAGNSQNDDIHYSDVIGPDQESLSFSMRVSNDSDQDRFVEQDLRVIWIDGDPNDRNIEMNLQYNNDSSYIHRYTGMSDRGTELQQYKLAFNIQAKSTRVFTFNLSNTADDDSARAHVYILPNNASKVAATFDLPDPRNTVTHPAVADSAIAVGAWTQRTDWTDWKGNSWTRNHILTLDTLVFFSSLGPRIDGLLKPDIVVPGAMTISCRPSWANLYDAYIIDNDGVPGGEGDYYITWGTSIACPYAAGIGALVLESNPSLAPAELRYILTSTASQAEEPDDFVGYGLVDAYAAVSSARTYPN